MKILISTPSVLGQVDTIRRQQSVVQLYCKEAFGASTEFLSGYVEPTASADARIKNPVALAMATLYQRLAEADCVFLGFDWETDRLCQMLKSYCEENNIPYYALTKFGG